MFCKFMNKKEKKAGSDAYYFIGKQEVDYENRRICGNGFIKAG